MMSLENTDTRISEMSGHLIKQVNPFQAVKYDTISPTDVVWTETNHMMELGATIPLRVAEEHAGHQNGRNTSSIFSNYFKICF